MLLQARRMLWLAVAPASLAACGEAASVLTGTDGGPSSEGGSSSSGASGSSSGGGSSGSSGGLVGVDGGLCPAIDRSCSSDSDCVAFDEARCCCDHYAGRRAAAPYVACVPDCGARGCGCAPSADDGRSPISGLAGIGVFCDAGACWSYVTH